MSPYQSSIYCGRRPPKGQYMYINKNVLRQRSLHSCLFITCRADPLHLGISFFQPRPKVKHLIEPGS